MKVFISLILSIALIYSCVQEMREITINYKVDMTAVDSVMTVGVIGEYEPMNWDTAIPLIDENDDGIYTGNITIKAAYNYAEFKFKLNNEIIELEGQGNRVVDFTGQKEVSYICVYDVK